MTDYARFFFCLRQGLRGWSVYSQDRDDAPRLAVGPFWSWVTARRVQNALTQNYRDGADAASRMRLHFTNEWLTEKIMTTPDSIGEP